MKNYGVIIKKFPSDYAAGSVPYQILNPMGDWEGFVPDGEIQYSDPSNGFGDTQSCVTFSALNSIEMQEYFLTGIKKNYSDRWIAKMSNTTKEGNWLQKVGDTIRQYGLVEEKDYPMPSAPFTFEQYHSEIPEPLLTELKIKGAEWLKTHDVRYEQTGLEIENIKTQLKQAPLWVVIPGHAIVEIKNIEDLTAKIYDTYRPFVKDIPQGNIEYINKIILTLKNIMPIFVHIKGTQEYGLMYPSEFVTTVVRFTSEADAKEKLKVETIDYSKAKEISL